MLIPFTLRDHIDTIASMGVVSRHTLFVLTLFQASVASLLLPFSSVPRYFQNNPFTRRQVLISEIARDLGTIVSSNSAIFLPSDPSWSEVTERWNTLAPPDIEIVVQPAEESEISKIVSAAVTPELSYHLPDSGFRSSIAMITASNF